MAETQHSDKESSNSKKPLGTVSYYNAEFLRRFMSPEGRILPQRRTELSAKDQRKVCRAIKRARCMGLVPFSNAEY